MKKRILYSLLAAVLIGPAIGLVSLVSSVQPGLRYDPPITQEEMDKLKNLPVREIEVQLAPRAKHISRMEWLRDSIRWPYFWKEVAGRSVLPFFGVFIACLIVGRLQERDEAMRT